jgi:hypothetical protein
MQKCIAPQRFCVILLKAPGVGGFYNLVIVMQLRRLSCHGGALLAAVILSLMLFSSGAGAAPFKKPCHWRYIVIHHSATRKGNAAIMDRYHSNRRHMQNGLAYHFVIGNGTSGCADGEVEESYRWRAQLPGGHSKQPWLNESGIGICLVGNFNRQTVSSKQMSSLVKLVNELCTTYNIPLSCIKGHGDFKGEHTMCPGYNFPMRRFKECLKKGNMPVSTKWSVANRKSNASMPAVSINERQNPYPVISERALPAKKRPVS